MTARAPTYSTATAVRLFSESHTLIQLYESIADATQNATARATLGLGRDDTDV